METPLFRPPTTFYRVSLKAVIHDEDGRILVVKEAGSNWSLPGGGWDHGESEHEALARELFEEANFRGEFESKIFATETMWLEHRESWLLWLVYEITIKDFNKQVFSVGADADAIAWMYPSEFKDIATKGGRWIFNNLV
jgi:8-oxo-dGTP pyrophosphatase MutT (NUDIX family)